MDATKLASLYPAITVRNRRGVQARIGYANGDSITVQPNASVTITTSGLHQLPSATEFELVRPTIFDLLSAGVITMKEQAES